MRFGNAMWQYEMKRGEVSPVRIGAMRAYSPIASRQCLRQSDT